MEQTCIICLSTINELSYSCADNNCKETYCEECVILLIEYSKDEYILPVCPSTNCNQILLVSDIPKKIVQMYEQLCFNFFIKEQGENVNKQLQNKLVLEKIREERMRFINKTYPDAIALIAEITFKSKIKKLEKIKEKLLKENQTNLRRCMNTTCTGYINEELVCLTCDSSFCKRCEKNCTKKHTCKQEDLDSVNIINDMIRCPTCQCPVFKNIGCDSITCSVCSTNFNYKSGEKTGHGSFNTKIATNINQKQKLSKIYSDRSQIVIELLLDVEAKEPKILNKDTLLQPIKAYYQQQLTAKSAGNKLAKQLNQYYKNKLYIREYQSFMVELEELLREKQNDRKIINKLKSF